MNREAEVIGNKWLAATPDHPFYVRDQIRYWDNDVRQYRWKLSEPDWRAAGKMQGTFGAIPMDVDARPIPAIPGRPIEVNDAFWYFVGRWLGDGWVQIQEAQPHENLSRSKYRSISKVFVCCAHQEASDLAAKLAATGVHWGQGQERTVARFVATHSGLAPWLVEHFGRYADGKRLPGWAFSLPETARAAILRGYLDADGTKRDNGWRAVTVGRDLAVSVRMLANTLGYTTSLNVITPRRATGASVIEGRSVSEKPQWQINICQDDGRYTRVIDGHRWVKMRKPLESRGRQTVYDLTVDEDHSFVAWGFVVHNCQPFSHAGPRTGKKDARHLWPHIAEGIRVLRPRIFVGENVRGHLSLGFDQVLADLHQLGYDVRWTLRAAAEAGAPHQRLRLFIVATDRTQDGALIAPSDLPIAEYGDQQWTEPATGLFGEVPFTGRIPNTGAQVAGALYSIQPSAVEKGRLVRLPTPAVNDMGGNKTVEWWDDWIVRMKALGVNANGHGKSLGIELQRAEQDGSWGEYGPAIERWEQVVGRPHPGRLVEYNGRKRAAPAFVEWMMGLPAGHVSDVRDLTVPKMLTALGNGVCPQQAELAVRWALDVWRVAVAPMQEAA